MTKLVLEVAYIVGFFVTLGWSVEFVRKQDPTGFTLARNVVPVVVLSLLWPIIIGGLLVWGIWTGKIWEEPEGGGRKSDE